MRGTSKNNLTRQLLDFFHTKKATLLDEFIKRHPEKADSIYTIVNRLEKLGLVQKFKHRHDRRLRSFFRLTEKGSRKLLPPRSTQPKSTWDGHWRLLIFDIPEEEKSTRDYLRGELKRQGFYMLQLSVWVTPYQVDKDLQELIREIGARDYVRFMIVKEVSYDKDILHFFRL